MKPRVPPEGSRHDVAIAIGIGVNKAGNGPNGRSRANALQAEMFYNSELYRANNILLLGGGKPHPITGMTEAAGMKLAIHWTRYQAEKTLFLEEISDSTLLNATAGLRIMKEQGWKSAIICAEALHAGRVESTFRKQWRAHGLEFMVIPTFGQYDESDGMFTTPAGFFFYNTFIAAPVSKFYGWS